MTLYFEVGLTDFKLAVSKNVVQTYRYESSLLPEPEAGGRPSTWSPPERLAGLGMSVNQNGMIL